MSTTQKTATQKCKAPSDYSPDWRWKSARSLCERGVTKDKDEIVSLCLMIVRAKRTGDHKALIKSQKKYPEVFDALDLYEATEDPRKDLLEAALLTEANACEIASFLCISEDVVAAYENIFFDVRRFLGSRGLVDSSVIQPALSQSSVERYHPGILKHIAYNEGWEMLKGFASLKPLPPALEDRLDELINAELTKATLAATTKANSIRPSDTVDLYLKMQGGTQAGVGSRGEDGAIERMISHVLTSQPFHRVQSSPPVEGAVPEPRALTQMKETICGNTGTGRKNDDKIRTANDDGKEEETRQAN